MNREAPQGTARSPVLALRQVSFSYGGTPIVANLDFSVEAAGEIVSVLGPSGVGKTTLMNLMLRLLQPEEGVICGNGKTLPVFQNFRSMVLPWFIAKQNIIWGAARKPDLLEEVVHLLDIEDRLDAYPAQLSGGQLQRVVLARALVRTPDLLLLDEPLSAVDLGTQRKLLPRLRDFLKQHMVSAVWITHNLEQSLTLSDRVAIMQEGGKFKEITMKARSLQEVRESVLEALLADRVVGS